MYCWPNGVNCYRRILRSFRRSNLPSLIRWGLFLIWALRRLILLGLMSLLILSWLIGILIGPCPRRSPKVTIVRFTILELSCWPVYMLARLPLQSTLHIYMLCSVISKERWQIISMQRNIPATQSKPKTWSPCSHITILHQPTA